MDSDWMELGDTGWIPVGDGTFVNIEENKMMDAKGNIYDLDEVSGDDI